MKIEGNIVAIHVVEDEFMNRTWQITMECETMPHIRLGKAEVKQNET